jgi:hypothetical protein
VADIEKRKEKLIEWKHALLHGMQNTVAWPVAMHEDAELSWQMSVIDLAHDFFLVPGHLPNPLDPKGVNFERDGGNPVEQGEQQRDRQQERKINRSVPTQVYSVFWLRLRSHIVVLLTSCFYTALFLWRC